MKQIDKILEDMAASIGSCVVEKNRLIDNLSVRVNTYGNIGLGFSIREPEFKSEIAINRSRKIRFIDYLMDWVHTYENAKFFLDTDPNKQYIFNLEKLIFDPVEEETPSKNNEENQNTEEDLLGRMKRYEKLSNVLLKLIKSMPGEYQDSFEFDRFTEEEKEILREYSILGINAEKEEDLLPCLFCDTDTSIFSPDDDYEERHYVYCENPDCTYNGASRNSKKLAAHAHNEMYRKLHPEEKK